MTEALPPLPPSGDQHEIEGGGYRAVATQSGATLRVLEHDGRPLLDGFALDAQASSGKGQVLVPWPNRLRDGRYTFEGTERQLALSEPGRHNASHGLVRWAPWWPVGEPSADAVTLATRVAAQSGYPWTLDVSVRYELGPGGLTVTQSATNRSGSAAPFASGNHPYLMVDGVRVDDLEVSLPAATRYLVDDRLVPVGREPVDATPYDLRGGGLLGDLRLDDAFTDLERDDDGLARVVLRDPASGRGVELWVDGAHHCLQAFTADEVPGHERRSMAVEPMSAPADAFGSGDHLVVLGPGETWTGRWGVRALG